jgi:hypothetical protein
MVIFETYILTTCNRDSVKIDLHFVSPRNGLNFHLQTKKRNKYINLLIKLEVRVISTTVITFLSVTMHLCVVLSFVCPPAYMHLFALYNE